MGVRLVFGRRVRILGGKKTQASKSYACSAYSLGYSGLSAFLGLLVLLLHRLFDCGTVIFLLPWSTVINTVTVFKLGLLHLPGGFQSSITHFLTLNLAPSLSTLTCLPLRCRALCYQPCIVTRMIRQWAFHAKHTLLVVFYSCVRSVGNSNLSGSQIGHALG